MNDTELAFRCVELAVRSGAQGDPGTLANLYFAAVKRLAPNTNNSKKSEPADKAKAPATAGKTARRKPAQNS